MTKVLITIDTELSAGLYQQGVSLADNIASSIYGRTAAGDYGVGWMIDRFDAHGLTGVFFIDPMPALVYGPGFLADIVGPIVARGHEVQLHIHTEWLKWAKKPIVAAGGKRNIGDYSPGDQAILLDYALRMIEAAGAPRPIAFRAGNFGANDATLLALAKLGIVFDSSFNGAIDRRCCAIDLLRATIEPVRHCGIVELPVALLLDRPGIVRAAQICAFSSWETDSLLRHAVNTGIAVQTIVTHSFEMLDRRRTRPNRSVIRRFEKLCRTIAVDPALDSAGFQEFDASRLVAERTEAEPLAPHFVRRTLRMIEQVGANLYYERSLSGGDA